VFFDGVQGRPTGFYYGPGCKVRVDDLDTETLESFGDS